MSTTPDRLPAREDALTLLPGRVITRRLSYDDDYHTKKAPGPPAPAPGRLLARHVSYDQPDKKARGSRADALFLEVTAVARTETMFNAFYARLAAEAREDASSKDVKDAQVRAPGAGATTSPLRARINILSLSV